MKVNVLYALPPVRVPELAINSKVNLPVPVAEPEIISQPTLYVPAVKEEAYSKKVMLTSSSVAETVPFNVTMPVSAS